VYQDKTLTCRECGEEFLFTAGEQEFYAAKGFENEPGRCPSCRAARKQQRNSRGNNRHSREMFKTTCAACGGEAEVPFRPSADRPVYCRDCYQASKSRW